MALQTHHCAYGLQFETKKNVWAYVETEADVL
jgi:hypothetical protein